MTEEQGFLFPWASLHFHGGSLGPQLPCLRGSLLVAMVCSLVSMAFLLSLGFSLSLTFWGLWTLAHLSGS